MNPIPASQGVHYRPARSYVNSEERASCSASDALPSRPEQTGCLPDHPANDETDEIRPGGGTHADGKHFEAAPHERMRRRERTEQASKQEHARRYQDRRDHGHVSVEQEKREERDGPRE